MTSNRVPPSTRAAADHPRPSTRDRIAPGLPPADARRCVGMVLFRERVKQLAATEENRAAGLVGETCREVQRRRQTVVSAAASDLTRSFYAAKAQFITIDDKGVTSPSETEIRIGDLDQAFIYIEPRLGVANRSAVAQQTGIAQDLKKIPVALSVRLQPGSDRASDSDEEATNEGGGAGRRRD
ncbi:hypothetical protein CSOJ01_05983 [Colletotrichum sojae]|uniref:Uncharacterized protein n=1 Tax=Colletotrichum sojae TaxID=2175907 RepID=A0A8H6JDF0_9PEZI|nr:hypothetical protein CSOJ01_05983 [Colletotrichum sojae]